MAGTARQRGSAAPAGAALTSQPSAAMHEHNWYMWARTVGGTSFDVVLTTYKNAHALHSSTRKNVEAPLSGFVLRGTLFLDPSGTICESMAGSTLVQSSADVEFESAYASLLSPGPEACIVSGHVLLGVAAADASTLSRNLLVDALETSSAFNRDNRLLRTGPASGHPVRRARADDVPETAFSAASLGARLRGVSARELGKTSVAQSAGVRRVLLMRVVWSDESAANAMNDATYLSYGANFVNFANNRTYGSMTVVPTYTTGCVYTLPNHTSVQANTAANKASVSGWIFDDLVYALALATPACQYSASNFEHLFAIIHALPTVTWAGIAFVPGSQFIVQVGKDTCGFAVQAVGRRATPPSSLAELLRPICFLSRVWSQFGPTGMIWAESGSHRTPEPTPCPPLLCSALELVEPQLADRRRVR